MAKQCEACASLGRDGGSPKKADRIRNLLVEGRLVLLCEMHAEQVHESGLENVDQLRQLLTEPAGLRSLMDRRSPLDRRIFPPRPEGRRHTVGRRSMDDDL